MNRVLKILLGVTVVLVVAVIYVLNPRLPSPEGEQSAALYQPGVLGVERKPIALVDRSRPTDPNGDFEGRPERELEGYLWVPQQRDAGPFPLIVYSHGFMSSVREPGYLVDFLVPKGYVVVAVNYPLTHGRAPGGANFNDVVNQPGDISFIIDALLARNADEDDVLYGLLDPARIAAAGLSLGGLTTKLVAYHRDLRDPRIAAAVSLAGPSSFLEPAFFQTTDIPFMMIAGSDDAMVPYEANAAPIPGKVDNSLLVNLVDGSHVGFADVSSVFMRWFRHPDRWFCPLLLRGLDREHAEAEPALPPDPGIGISTNVAMPCAMETWDRAMRPATQQMLTRLALYAFLEQAFADATDRRQAMARYLTEVLATENADVSVTAAAGR